MVYAIKHGESDLDMQAAAQSSAVVVPVRQPFFGKLARGAKQSSARLKEKYSHLSQSRHSPTREAHKAMVQRFQLRRLSSSDPNPRYESGAIGSRRRSSLIISSFNYFKQQLPVARRSYWHRALKKLEVLAHSSFARLQQPIAPDGRLQQARELALLLAFALQIIYVPFVAAFVRDKTVHSFVQLHFTFESVFILDLLLAFNTSFYNKDGTVLITSRPEIAHRYLRSWFVVDLLAAVPFDSIGLLSHQRVMADLDAGGGFVALLLIRVPKLVHQMSLSPVFKAARVIHMAHRFWTWMQYSRYSHLLRITKLIAGILVIAHYMSCTWELLKTPETMALQRMQNLSPFVVYVNNFYYSMLLLQGQGTDGNSKTMAQNAYNIGAIMLGSLMLAVVFGNVAMLVANFYANSTSYQRKMESVFDTMNKMQLPHELRDRIHQYYEHLWHEYECLDGDIVKFSKRLTHSLELEVGLFKYMDLVVNIPFWKECSPDFITQIVLSLDVRVYLPDDYVIRKGETGEQLFMINKGKCELVQFIKPRSSSTESTGTGGAAGNGSFTGKPTTSSTSSNHDVVSDSEEEETRRTQADRRDGGAEERTYYHFRQGESFGELALLMNYRRTGSVRAVSYVEMCILTREKFQNVLFKYPADRKKVLLMILKLCIKNNLLKDIPYPWKELLASCSTSRTTSAAQSTRRNLESTMMKKMTDMQQRKFCRSNRRVSMFGEKWTVNEVAAAFADKIDVEHRDESIVFGFQAADLKPIGARTGVGVQDGGQQSSLCLNSSASLSAIGSEDARSPSFLSRAEAPASTMLHAELNEPAKSQPPLLETMGTDESSGRKRRRASSIGAAAAGELKQQPRAETVANLLTQIETMKARLGKVEAVEMKVLSTLAALTESVLQLNAFTAGAASSHHESHDSNYSKESAFHPTVEDVASARSSTFQSAQPPHQKSVAGHESRRRSSRHHQRRLHRGETITKSFFTISQQRPDLPKRRSADG